MLIMTVTNSSTPCILHVQIMRRVLWSTESGCWVLAPQPDLSVLMFDEGDSDDQVVIGSPPVSSSALQVLLARPPWDLQSASSASSWQVRARGGMRHEKFHQAR